MAGRRRCARHCSTKGTGELIAFNQTPQSGRSSGVSPSDMYACFLWKAMNPPQFYARDISSPVFDVCGTKWIISTCPDPEYPNCMSLFLCVANHDKILPGWSQFAQFTVSLINEDPMKSIHCDGFHRFSRSELDWGWKDFMTLKELVDGFMHKHGLEFKIQVQLIREKPNPNSSYILRSYRRELFREMGFEIEETCFNFFKEQKSRIIDSVTNIADFSSFGAFYASLEKGTRQKLSQERTDLICTSLVENLMQGEDTNTAVLIEVLYLGMEALVNAGNPNSQTTTSIHEDTLTSSVYVENGMFALADNIPRVVDSVLKTERPWRFERTLDLKERNHADDLEDEYTYEEEDIFSEIGRSIVQMFAVVHIFCENMYPEYLKHLSLKRQEELLQELEMDAEKNKQIQNHQKGKKDKKKNRKQKAKVNKLEVQGQQNDAGTDQVGEDIPQTSRLAISEKFLQEHKENYGSTPNTANPTNQLESEINSRSIDENDGTWTRKERKKSRATPHTCKQSRGSYQVRNNSSKEHMQKDYSLKKEPSGNSGGSRRIVEQCPPTENPKRNNIQISDALRTPVTSLQPSRPVDLSQKSWADFHSKLTFEMPYSTISSSNASDEYPYMNMINYLMEDEFL